MTVYTGDCHCGARSPRFISSELAERWLVEHHAEKHPDLLNALRARALRGELRPIHVGPGGVVVDADGVPIP
jgi:hypothetical protein